MNKVRVTLPIEGFGCGGGDARAAEGALADVPGVIRAYVNPATEMAYVEYDADRVAPRALVAAIERVGLRASAPSRR